MAVRLDKGESIFVLFENGKSVYNSQMYPRMYKTREQACQNSDLSIEGRELVEYTPVVYGRWNERIFYDDIICSICGHTWNVNDNCTETFRYCPNCGAKMNEEE